MNKIWVYNDQDEYVDRRINQREDGSRMQFPFLNGPEGVMWQIHMNYSESARMLFPQHRENAFVAAYVKENWDYCRYLGINMDDKVHLKYPDQWVWVLKKTKKRLIAGRPHSTWIGACQQFLTYLGDLHVQIARCLENGVLLSGVVRDLRACDLGMFTKWLDDKKIPQTNEQNPYRCLGRPAFPTTAFHNAWMKQNDSQINRLHKLLDCRS